MRTHQHPLALAAALIAVLTAGCAKLDPIAPPPLSTGGADFSSYVALGTSVSMGIQSGGLLANYQAVSFPALIARQAHANNDFFRQPLCNYPGLPNLIRLVSLSPLTFGTLPGTPPAAPYAPRPADGYDNLAISGADLASVIARDSGAPYFDFVLQGQGTMLRQCLAQDPTFITVELGATEAVRPLLQGGDPSALVPVPVFATLYAQLLDSLTAGAPSARLALSNLPQVTLLPYAATLPLFASPPPGPGGAAVRLRDAAGPLPDGSLILLPASPLIDAGYGWPDPAPPLPDSLVITLAERAAIEDAIRGYNAVIAAEASARGAALVDASALYARLHAQGVVIGGVRYTTAFVTGGLFSLDGIHPSTLGSGLLANAFLEAINRRYGARIAPVDLSVLTRTRIATGIVLDGR
ncbi:MAG: SGNH/GDSL hydrolase family protein [Candidatus Eisenbacteria bacterium]